MFAEPWLNTARAAHTTRVSRRPPAPSRASTLQLPPGDWASVLDCLCAQFPAIARTQWQERMARGRVLDAQNRPLTPAAPYRAGMTVRYFREVAAEPAVSGVESLLHVDEHLVVADKPHGLPVTPSGPYVEQTLLARLSRRLRNAELVPLHRIDRATAGLVLFSARRDSRAAYQALFRERRIDKHYEALAPALPQLRFPLLRRSRLVPGEPFFLMREIPGEANSETRIDVLERGGPLWRYALQPITGRKHQLRVHLAALGAPIAGDPWYPRLREPQADDPAQPLRLLARALEFRDPLDGAPRCFESQLKLPPA